MVPFNGWNCFNPIPRYTGTVERSTIWVAIHNRKKLLLYYIVEHQQEATRTKPYEWCFRKEKGLIVTRKAPTKDSQGLTLTQPSSSSFTSLSERVTGLVPAFPKPPSLLLAWLARFNTGRICALKVLESKNTMCFAVFQISATDTLTLVV